MPKLMRCLYCGLLQDEPAGVKVCARCGGELAFEQPRTRDAPTSGPRWSSTRFRRPPTRSWTAT